MSAASVLLRGMIRAYQLILAPVLGSNCRFSPSCSAYAREAIALHGAAQGGILAFRRLVRCNPWGPGGYDPVPCHDGAGHRRPMDSVAAPIPADSATGFRE